ncbi:MAG TPA: KpsF/GutQ family sugar-phosphate isomerase [Gemmatimonadaceae bacterium]|jgi:arabinose-5-phosphate isomerase|nr:KpsF/GutQ family sugar-phosphate isomerase [Gemmatimonadaceae bacterium]
MKAVATEPAVERGRAVLRMEREALAEAERRLDERFARAVELIASAPGRVIVTGVGKSGIVGRKIAATLTSTGTPATFVHPVESVHGDLGIVGPDDVAILLSKSGETQELLPLLEHLKRLGVRIVAFTGTADSTLGRHADVVVDTWVREEACPHDLAPTTSTTVALALGDALAVVLLERKAFRREDFALLHPGGALGRQLLTRVADVMVTSPLPALPPHATMREAVVQLAERRGTVAIIDDRKVVGVLTAGDLTRLMEREREFMELRVDTVMNRAPKLAREGELGSAVVYRMQQFGVMAMPVTDDDARLVGMVHLHDLMRAGVV